MLGHMTDFVMTVSSFWVPKGLGIFDPETWPWNTQS